jgi:hypothetical protein
MWRSFLRTIGIISLSALGWWSSFNYWKVIRNNWNPALLLNDPVSKWEKRIGRVEFPSNIQKIGYVADWDIDPTFSPIDQDQEYVLTQYTLAPIIVNKGIHNCEWIIGNLTLPETQDWLHYTFKGAEIRSYGWGIYLIHMVKP